jgi:hypothetical protein
MNTRKKAKIISKCLDDVRSGSKTRKNCLSQYPILNEELKMAFKLLDTFKAESLDAVSEHQLRIAKINLLNKLPDRKNIVTKYRHFRYKLQNMKRSMAMNWLVIVAIVLSLVSGSGVVYASTDALPGEVLYPVKILAEGARIWFASDSKDLEIIEETLNRRIHEISTMLDMDDDNHLVEIIGLYENHFELLQQSFERIQAKDPEEAIRLRTELEARLQEQARLLENLIFVEANGENQKHQNQLEQMLEINQKNQFRVNEEEQEIEFDDILLESIEPAHEETGAGENGNQEEGSGEVSGESHQQQFTGQYLQNDRLKFEFQFDNLDNEDVYARVNDQDYECVNNEGKIVCDMSGSPGEGVINLYNAETHELVFSCQYQHRYEHLWGDEEDKGNITGSENGHGDMGNGKDK